MEIDEIIDRNSKSDAYGFIAQFAYHYTDIHNAINILKEGKLYSRNLAIEKGLMVNDNASEEVISNTRSSVFDCVRLYFRPKTPTQYYNEGYKHPKCRFKLNHDANVNILSTSAKVTH